MRFLQVSASLLLLQSVLVSVQGAMRIYGDVTVTAFINHIDVTMFDNGVDYIKKKVVTTAFDSWSSTIDGSGDYKCRAWWNSGKKTVVFEWSRPGMSDTLECPATCTRDCVGDGSKMDPKRCVTWCDYSCWYY